MLFTSWSYMNMHIWHTDIPHIYIMYIIYMCILYMCVLCIYIHIFGYLCTHIYISCIYIYIWYIYMIYIYMCIHIMVDGIYFSHLANIIHCSSLPPRLTRNSFRRSVVSLVASLPSNNSSKRRAEEISWVWLSLRKTQQWPNG